MTTAVIIQARTGSTRFPRKVLADLCGKPVIQHVVERAKAIKGADRVILACPEADGPTFSALNLGVEVVAYTKDGNENDMLSRFRYALPFSARLVVRVTGDCPFLAPDLAEEVIDLVDAWSPYACTRHDGAASGWPDGLDVEACETGAIVKAHMLADSASDREHVTPWLRRTYRWIEHRIPAGVSWPSGCKLSLDTPEDLPRLARIMAQIKPGDYGWEATRQAVIAERGAR